MDGDVSHSSEIKLPTFTSMSAFLFAFLFPSLFFHLTVMFTSMFCSVFVLSRLFFSFTSGASSPEWVKPAAEGGGLSRICFLFICLFFVIAVPLHVCVWFFLDLHRG
jgi:hypothetical protein